MNTQQTTRSISFSEIAHILKTTALDSAPKLQIIAQQLQVIGEQADIDPLEQIGEGLEQVIRITLLALGVPDVDGVTVLDDSVSSRGNMQEQRIADMVRARIHEQAR